MLNSISVENFKGLKRFEANFTEGLNVIVGENASGKTTLTEAIVFALYGVKAVPVKAENIPTWGEKNCAVTLNLYGHKVVRTLNNCKVFKGDELVASGNTPCSKYLQDNLTGMDLRGFRMFNWSAQGETGALLTLGALQLQRDIEKFSGVEFVDQVIKEASADLRTLKSTLDGRELIEEAPVREALEDTKKKLERVAKVLNDCNGEYEGLQSKVRDLNSRISTAKELESSRKGLESDLETVEESLSNLQVRKAEWTEKESELLEKLDQLEDSTQKVSELKVWVAKQEEYMTYKEEVERLQNRVAECRSNLKGDQLYLEHEELVHLAEERHTELVKVVSEITKSIQALESELESGICAACGRPLEGFEEEELREELGLLKPKLSKVEQEAAASQSEYLSKLESGKHLKFGAWQGHLEQAEVNLNTLLMSPKESVGSIKELRDKLSEAQGALEVQKTLQEERSTAVEKVNKLCESIVRSQSKADRLRGELSSLPEPEPYEGLVKEAKEGAGRLSELSDIRHQQELTKVQLENLRMSQEARLQTVIDNNGQIAEGLKHSKLLDKFVRYLKGSREKFMSSVWSSLLGLASDFVNRATQGSISELKRDDSGFLFYSHEVYAPVSSASGAQKGFIGVAVRMALAQTLKASMPLTILDEPTESMRDDNASRLAGSLLGNGQVLMITHRESDQLVGSNIIEVSKSSCGL